MPGSAEATFKANPVEGREELRLVVRERRSLPLAGSIERSVPFDDWALKGPSSARPAIGRLLQSWADNQRAPDGSLLVTAGNDHVLMHPALVAALSDAEAVSLGLPPTARLSLNLQSAGLPQQSNFRVDTRWTRPNGLPAHAQPMGARVRTEGKDWRIAEPIWTTLQCVERLNTATGEAGRQTALAALRTAIGDEDRVHIKPDGFIEQLRLSYAAGFSLELRASANGFDFDPVLFSPERLREAGDGTIIDEAADSLLAPAQQASFAKRFRSGDGSRRAYLLDDGSILFLDPTLHRALGVVREAQAAGPDARRDFARNPQRRLAVALSAMGEDAEVAAALFVETQQFSERVSGIDIWRKPVMPWVKPKPNSWLPEAFGIRIGEPPNATMVEIAPERVADALTAVEAAVREERSSFEFDGVEIPATEQTRAALTDLAGLLTASSGTSGVEGGPPPAAQRYFLQVRDNLEDLVYAPIASAAPADEQTAPFPQDVRSPPKPHQVAGFDWLVRCWRTGIPGALLADDMGLGKTFQALAFLTWLRVEQPTPKPVLIVAPTGLLANWRAEIERHLAPNSLGPVISAYGSALHRMRDTGGRDIDLGRSAIDPEAWSGAGIVLTTFETMRDYHLSFARQPFAAIIYDEVQKLKNPASQMTRAAKTLNARFQLAMTGTPVENRLQDLWSIYDVIHPGLLGSSKTFEASYPASDHEKLRSLNDLLTQPSEGRPPLLLRRMKDDCLPGLPAKHVLTLPTPMPPAQAAAYERVIQRAFTARASGRRGYMLEILHLLRGVSLHPVDPEDARETYLEQSARLQSAFDTLDRISAAGEKALVFCESLSMQALLAVEIRRRYGLAHDVARIHGGVTGDARQAAVDAFQSRPKGFDAMILSPKAGGVGLTLTAANHVIHLSRWWNPAVEDQATDRVFRIGQTKDVHVYLPQAVHPDPTIGPSSFDLKLDALMTRKRELSQGLLLPGEDEGDIDALFESVLARSEPDEGSVAEPEQNLSGSATVEPSPITQPVTSGRPTLSVRTGEAPPATSTAARWPTRAAFVAGGARDFRIFEGPVSGEQILELAIRDPYGCAGGRNRQCLVDFVALIARKADRIGDARIVSFDAESIDSRDYENDNVQRDDLERRWRQKFPNGPSMHHIQLSRRQSRSFHDRTVRAKTASGREIIWDISNGLDGVMLTQKECTVHVLVE